MTNQEAKETLNKSEVVRLAEASIRDMSIKLAKYKGNKTEQEKHLSNLRNLLNLSVKQGYDLDVKQDELSKYLIKIGELSAELRDMKRKFVISEQIHEVGIDEVVESFKSKVLH